MGSLVHKAMQLTCWSNTPERDQRAIKIFEAILFTYQHYLDVIGTKEAPAKPALQVVADQALLAKYSALQCLKPFEKQEEAIATLERLLRDTELGASAVKRMAEIVTVLMQKFTQAARDFLDSPAAQAVIPAVEAALKPLRDAEAKAHPGKDDGP